MSVIIGRTCIALIKLYFLPLLYFDHNATTPVAPEVADALDGSVRQVWGNASSIHSAGQIARQQLEQARRTIASFLRAKATELVFTSGGTESNNIAILGLVRGFTAARKHIVTTTIEHPAVLEPCRQLEREGVEVSYVGAGRNGVVAVEAIRAAIRSETVLVSVMHANNETGVLQPVAAIGRLVRELREAGQTIYFHSDGVQAFGKVPVDLNADAIDLYSTSAHKIYAPKGIGLLFVSKRVPLRGIQFGGRHERERRAGTENVPGAVAFARAVELCASYPASFIAGLRDRFEKQVGDALPDVQINGRSSPRLPNTSSVTFHGASGEGIVIALDLLGMAVSSGSACSSGSTEPSHVLLAMGLRREEARSSVRFSFGRYNTEPDVDALADSVIKTARRLRKSSAKEAHVVTG